MTAHIQVKLSWFKIKLFAYKLSRLRQQGGIKDIERSSGHVTGLTTIHTTEVPLREPQSPHPQWWFLLTKKHLLVLLSTCEFVLIHVSLGAQSLTAAFPAGINPANILDTNRQSNLLNIHFYNKHLRVSFLHLVTQIHKGICRVSEVKEQFP